MVIPRLRNHLLFWTLYVVFKTYLNIAADSSEFSSAFDQEWNYYHTLLFMQISILSIKIPLVYSCFFVLDQYLQQHWKLWHTILGFTVLFSTGVVLMTLLNHFFILPVILHFTGETLNLFAISSLLYHFFTLAFVTGIAISLRLMRRQYRSGIRELRLQKEKTEAELKYLKGQINPHFLFNTLNNIYSLARKNAPETAASVLKLSKLMRFMLYHTGHPTILVSDELSLIDDYIALERLRYTDRLQITYTKSIDDLQQRIAPLLLIHFVENAFKHGASESRKESFINIDITIKEGGLSACIVNSKSSDLQSNSDEPIGLENIKRQLQLIYPDHQLTITNAAETFQVTLTIPLNHTYAYLSDRRR